VAEQIEPRLLRIAEAEHANAREALAAHIARCVPCPDCVSLTAHAERTRRQVELLAGDDDAETGALF
jgi:hypothetical protein